MTKTLEDVEERALKDLADRNADLLTTLSGRVTSERYVEIMAGLPDDLQARHEVLVGIVAREAPPFINAAQVLLVWLTGEGPAQAIYGVLAALGREVSSAAVAAFDGRIAAAFVHALPFLASRASVEGAHEHLIAYWDQFNVPRPVVPERAVLLAQTLAGALDAGSFFDHLTIGGTRASLIESMLAFGVRAERFIAHLERLIPDDVAPEPQTAARP